MLAILFLLFFCVCDVCLWLVEFGLVELLQRVLENVDVALQVAYDVVDLIVVADCLDRLRVRVVAKRYRLRYLHGERTRIRKEEEMYGAI